MGIYVYSLRKKKSKIYVGAEEVEAQHYEYAYKVSYSQEWNGDKGYRLRENNTERLAEQAFDVYNGGYVIVGEGEGASVYKNVTDPRWYDTDSFPGEYVGTLGKFGPWLLVEELAGHPLTS